MSAQESRRGSVLITGASTGIGKACALYLDRLGFRVFAGVRKPADGEALRKDASDRLTPVIIDVTDAGSIATAAASVSSAVGDDGLQGLVNNAGVVVAGPIELLPMDDLRRQMEVNLLGHVAVTQAFLPLIRKGRGRIVNMGSISGVVTSPFVAPYAMSKFAMEAFTDGLRMELKPWGIEVSLLEPGSIATPIWDKSQNAGSELYERLPKDGLALYEPQLKMLRKASRKMGEKGIPPERVAEKVAHALTARRPKTRYVIGKDSRLLKILARWVPDRLRDKMILKGLQFSGR